MGRSGSVGSVALIASLCLFGLLAISLSACGGGGATKVVPDEVPANISLSPATNASMDLGATQSFIATAHNRNNQQIPETFSYQSTNPTVITVANTGQVCAGTWDSLTAPTTCTPGAVGVAQVTATAFGISSPPTIVYVHQHITSIQISVVPSPTNPPGPCYSKDQTLDFQASAYSGSGNNLTDITSSVGQFTWQVDNASVVTLKTLTQTSTNQPVLNQTETTANTPGTTSIYAGLSGVNSAPFNFVTCAVQQISLYVLGDSSNSFVVPTGTSKTIYATVLDTLGNTITGVPLTWSSSNRTSVAVSASTSTLYGGVGTANASAVGASAVIASCTPPTCNIGFTPLLPIYPTGTINFIVTGTGTASTSYSLYVTSKGTGVNPSNNQAWSCAATPGCISRIIPITGSSTGTNTVAPGESLPSTPDSLLFEPGGTTAFMGVDSGQLGTRGLMVLTPGTSGGTQHTSAPGKVLAVSPDGRTVVISDTVDQPNQVYLFNTTSSSATPLNITGATAAAFSPDNLKAYIVAGNILYIYSTLDALKTVELSPGSPGFAATDVTFLPAGAFAFISGGPPNTVTAYTTCHDAIALAPLTNTPQVIATPGLPSMLRPLPNGTQVLAMDPPGVDYLDVSTTPIGCPPTLNSSLATSVNLGQGDFVPTQFIVSPDGLTAYILTQNSGIILVLNIANQTTTGIALTGNAIALQASLTPDGKFLYVGAEDAPLSSPTPLGTVHVLDTTAGSDVQQITFTDLPQPFCVGAGTPSLPPPSPVTYCYPDLIAVKP